jgi:hypothetical protein
MAEASKADSMAPTQPYATYNMQKQQNKASRSHAFAVARLGANGPPSLLFRRRVSFTTSASTWARTLDTTVPEPRSLGLLQRDGRVPPAVPFRPPIPGKLLARIVQLNTELDIAGGTAGPIT